MTGNQSKTLSTTLLVIFAVGLVTCLDPHTSTVTECWKFATVIGLTWAVGWLITRKAPSTFLAFGCVGAASAAWQTLHGVAPL